jgi:hypothetical protein
VVSLFPTLSKKVKSVTLKGQVLKEKDIIVGLDIYFTESSFKAKDIKPYLMLTSVCNKGYNYSSSYRLPIPISKTKKCSLWSNL